MKKLLNEAAMEGFSTEQLKTLNSFQKRKKYCDNMLGSPIGKGSARIVYQIDDEKVLKLAFNSKGVAQNEAEADWNAQNYGVVPTLYDVDDDYMYIISEYVIPAKKQDFKEILGMSFEDFQQVVMQIYNKYARRPVGTRLNWEQFEEIMENNEWLYQLNMFMSDYGMPYGDIVALRNLGICNRDGEAEIVVLDYGFNEEISKLYYS